MPTPVPTPAPTVTTTKKLCVSFSLFALQPLSVNCDKCTLGSLVAGSPDWCRCCTSADYCSSQMPRLDNSKLFLFLFDKPIYFVVCSQSVFSRQGCYNDGFCSSRCVSEPLQYCQGVTTQAPTPMPITTAVWFFCSRCLLLLTRSVVSLRQRRLPLFATATAATAPISSRAAPTGVVAARFHAAPVASKRVPAARSPRPPVWPPAFACSRRWPPKHCVATTTARRPKSAWSASGVPGRAATNRAPPTEAPCRPDKCRSACRYWRVLR